MDRQKSPGLSDDSYGDKPNFGNKDTSCLPGFSRESKIFVGDDGNSRE
jgi:hypothetical protein